MICQCPIQEAKKRVQVSLFQKQEGTIYRMASFYTLSYPSFYLTLSSIPIEWYLFTRVLFFPHFHLSRKNLVVETAYPDRDPFSVSQTNRLRPVPSCQFIIRCPTVYKVSTTDSFTSRPLYHWSNNALLLLSEARWATA